MENGENKEWEREEEKELIKTKQNERKKKRED